MSGSMNVKYMEEAFELIAQMEHTLLAMESQPGDAALIEQIFRDMHTLKGNSAMMGYKLVADLTHQLESAYESIRSLKVAPSENLINVTLASLDHLKLLIQKDCTLSEGRRPVHDSLMAKIIGIVITSANSAAPVQPALAAEDLTGSKRFRIVFSPHTDMLKNGGNPLYLLDELCALGHCEVRADVSKLPLLEHCGFDTCYTSWEIILTTTNGDAINSVFEFQEHTCHLTVEVIGDDCAEQALTPAADPPPTGKSNTTGPAKNHFTNSIASIRVPSERLDNMMNLVSELTTLQAKFTTLAGQHGQSELLAATETLEKLSTQLRDNAFSMCLVPVEHLTVPFKRLVRDLSLELNKKIQFITEGTETELDKNIMEGLSDPLMHLLRNSIDHGIESPEERNRVGKPEEGTITLKAFCAGTNVFIEMHDDGRGMNTQKIKEKAIEKGIITRDVILTEKEILNLIFLPGFSTADQLSEISGRGVGMDVVKRRINDIRGELKISSEVHKGTTITIKLPLTVSIIDGLQVTINRADYIIPLSSVHKCYEVASADVLNEFNDLACFEDRQIPFINVPQLFYGDAGLKSNYEMVVVYHDDKKVGLLVDTVVGKFQAVLKPLGPYFSDIPSVSGATIMGNGSIALVLETSKVIEQYIHRKQEQICQ